MENEIFTGQFFVGLIAGIAVYNLYIERLHDRLWGLRKKIANEPFIFSDRENGEYVVKAAGLIYDDQGIADGFSVDFDWGDGVCHFEIYLSDFRVAMRYHSSHESAMVLSFVRNDASSSFIRTFGDDVDGLTPQVLENMAADLIDWYPMLEKRLRVDLVFRGRELPS